MHASTGLIAFKKKKKLQLFNGTKKSRESLEVIKAVDEEER